MSLRKKEKMPLDLWVYIHELWKTPQAYKLRLVLEICIYRGFHVNHNEAYK